jgi:hypothetical protein
VGGEYYLAGTRVQSNLLRYQTVLNGWQEQCDVHPAPIALNKTAISARWIRSSQRVKVSASQVVDRKPDFIRARDCITARISMENPTA